MLRCEQSEASEYVAIQNGINLKTFDPSMIAAISGGNARRLLGL